MRFLFHYFKLRLKCIWNGHEWSERNDEYVRWKKCGRCGKSVSFRPYFPDGEL